MSNSITFGRADNAGATVDAITAVGTARAGSPTLTGLLNIVTTAAGQVAATLPASHPQGSPVIVRTTTATAATIFPPAGGSINGGAVDAAFSVAQNKPTVFFAHPNGLDFTAVLSA